MAKIKKKKLQWWWFILPIFALVLFAYYNFSNSSTDYLVYQDPTYGFSMEYPQAWEKREDTQVFENGDVISFQQTGPTQKAQTEFYDGGKVTIAKPFQITMSLIQWVKEHHNGQYQFSQQTINNTLFEKVTDCSIGCSTFYYAMKGNDVFGIFTFAQGENKMVYENAIVYMLKSIRFTTPTNKMVTKDEAITKVKAIPEVIGFLKEVPNGLVAVNGEENDVYMVQVYELKDNHTATFNWYTVDKTTGETTKEF